MNNVLGGITIYISVSKLKSKSLVESIGTCSFRSTGKINSSRMKLILGTSNSFCQQLCTHSLTTAWWIHHYILDMYTCTWCTRCHGNNKYAYNISSRRILSCNNFVLYWRQRLLHQWLISRGRKLLKELHKQFKLVLSNVCCQLYNLDGHRRKEGGANYLDKRENSLYRRHWTTISRAHNQRCRVALWMNRINKGALSLKETMTPLIVV